MKGSMQVVRGPFPYCPLFSLQFSPPSSSALCLFLFPPMDGFGVNLTAAG